MAQHVLVTGGAGYLGSIVVARLVKEGYRVTVIDNFTFGNNLKGQNGFELIERDVLEIDPTSPIGVDAIVHLAGLSNDPMANFRPRDNYIHNSAMTGLLVYLAKKAGVKRFVFGSTCSIYGYSVTHEMTEECPVSPSFPYGISKMHAEYAIMSALSDDFRPIVFRQATVFGWAPRMRFDLVVNTMTKAGVRTGKIRVANPNLFRPLIHVEDIAEAYVRALNQPLEVTGTFNISGANYNLLELGQEVQQCLGERGFDTALQVDNEDDPRSYRVRTDRAETILGLKPKRTVRDGVLGILDKFPTKDDPAWEDKWFINAEVYRSKIVKEERLSLLWKSFLTDITSTIDVSWKGTSEGP